MHDCSQAASRVQYQCQAGTQARVMQLPQGCVYAVTASPLQEAAENDVAAGEASARSLTLLSVVVVRDFCRRVCLGALAPASEQNLMPSFEVRVRSALE